MTFFLRRRKIVVVIQDRSMREIDNKCLSKVLVVPDIMRKTLALQFKPVDSDL